MANVITRFGSNYKWLVVGLLFLAGFLNLEDRVVIFSLLPLIRRELHLSDLQLGAMMSAFLWVYAACSPFAGYLGDRLSRRWVLIGSVLLWSLVTLLAGFVVSGWQLLGTRALLGVTQAFYIPASIAILGDCHTSATRGKAIAVLGVGMGLGPILGGAGAGWLGDHHGWRLPMFVLGSAGLLLAVAMFALLQDVRVGSSEARPSGAENTTPGSLKDTLKNLAGNRSYILLAIAVGIVQIAVWILLTWLPVFLYDSFNMNLTQSGFFANLALTGPVMVGMLIGGILSDALGGQKPRNRLLLIIAFYSLALPWLVLFWQAGTAVAVLSSAAAFILFRALAESSLYPLLYEVVPAKQRSTAIGISNSLNSTLAGLGAIVVGYFKESFGLQRIVGLVPVMMLLSVGALLLILRFTLQRDLVSTGPLPGQPAANGAVHASERVINDIH